MELVQVSILVTLLTLSGGLHDGLKAFQGKKYQESITELSKVCEKDIPENKFMEIALFYRAQSYKETGDKEKALTDLLTILKKFPQSPFGEKSREMYLAWGGKPENLVPEQSPKKVWEQFMLAAGKADLNAAMRLSTGMWKELVMKETRGRPDRLKKEFRPEKLIIGDEKIGKDKEAGTATLIVTAENHPMLINFILDTKENRWLISGFNQADGMHLQNEPWANVNNLKQIGLALRMYSNDNNELFPKDIKDLKAGGYLEVEEIYLWTHPANGKKAPFIYCPGFKESSNVESIIAAAPQPFDGKRDVLYIDGHVKTITEDEFLKIAKTQKWQAEGIFKIEDIPKATQEKVRQLVKNLADSKYEVRKQAKADLIAIGADAFPILEQYKQDEDPEIKMTVISILEGK